MELASTSKARRRGRSPLLSQRRPSEKSLIAAIWKCMLGALVVGGLFAVNAASRGIRLRGQVRSGVGVALEMIAIFLGLGVVLSILLVIRYVIEERAARGRAMSKAPTTDVAASMDRAHIRRSGFGWTQANARMASRRRDAEANRVLVELDRYSAPRGSTRTSRRSWP